MASTLQELRKRVMLTAHQVFDTGLVQGTSGNVSARDEETGLVAITPTGFPYDQITEDDIVIIDLDGNVQEGRRKPSSETPMHTRVYRDRSWVGGVVHTHSPFATTFSVLGQPIPAIHYVIAFLGHEIPVAPYATYGTPELAANASLAMGECRAVLLANHGVLTAAESIEQAFQNAHLVEYLATLYYRALSTGLEPKILPREEILRNVEKFKTYGQYALPEA